MDKGAIFTRDGRFMDREGRHVILHGINLVNKDPAVRYLGDEGPETFAELRRWGLNCIRLGVIWDGIEPQPGVIDEAYLRGVEQRITWAGEAGLYVILDMHQDLYSVLYADGAPTWATITDGQPHSSSGDVWSDAYFTSPAVQTALDHFWRNDLAPDGRGLQEHYALAWQAVARRAAHAPAVIGYDLMNEPFPGSPAVQPMLMMLMQGAELLATLDGGGPSGSDPFQELAAQWAHPQGRAAILNRLRDPQLYARVVDVTAPSFSAFELEALMPMYRRVARAIREVDTDKILFLESSVSANIGVYSAIEPLQDETGARDPQQAYAPHGYDLVVDTEYITQSSPERVALIFSRQAETAERLGMPMLVGEWGAFYLTPGTLPAARMVTDQFERLLCSDTCWAYVKGLPSADSFPAISRPYMERCAGTLKSYRYDPQSGIFACTWQENAGKGSLAGKGAPGWVYLPGWFAFSPDRLVLEPYGSGYRLEPAGSLPSDGTWLLIPPAGEEGSRMLAIRA